MSFDEKSEAVNAPPEVLAQLELNIAPGLGKRDWVEHDGDLDSLRDDPRFVALLAKLP